MGSRRGIELLEEIARVVDPVWLLLAEVSPGASQMLEQCVADIVANVEQVRRRRRAMPEAYKRCVRKVSKKKNTRNAHAICTARNAGGIKQYRKRERRRRRKT
jgi:hypothetical protein